MALAFRHPMPAKSASDPSSATPATVLREDGIEYGFIGNLSGEIVKSIAVGFPSTAEPQRIASCLSSLDALGSCANGTTAYQPRVQPWEWDGGYGCVLKERRIGRARVGGATICGVPSERGVGGPLFPGRCALFPGRCPGLVCMAPLEPKTHVIESSCRNLSPTFSFI
jgi:hypothetical protein